ncbi:MAG TPA: hypothetical protein PKC12_07160 [Thiobacillaceae bacterium]|nr:hypothetical protein [Thiobacillaceae bacterium]
MTSKTLTAALLSLMLGACVLPPEPVTATVRPSPAEESAAPLMLAELARIEGLGPEQRRREIADLDAARSLTATRRFQLAALLARDDASESLERSLKVLAGMPRNDARTRALVDLMRQSIKARADLAQQIARSQELQDKLDQIKALEKSLQQRATPEGKP